MSEFCSLKSSQENSLFVLESQNPNAAQSYDWKDSISQIMIGRHPSCTVVLKDERVSTYHCYLTLSSKSPLSLSIRDNSTNGCFLNGVLVNSS